MEKIKSSILELNQSKELKSTFDIVKEIQELLKVA